MKQITSTNGQESAIKELFGNAERQKMASIAAEGTAVYAIEGGKIAFVQFGNGWGNHIAIPAGDLLVLYAHLKELPKLNQGDLVETGSVIGSSGATETPKNDGEPHLHVEVRKQNNGEPYNHMEKLNIENYLSTKFDNNNNPINCSNWWFTY